LVGSFVLSFAVFTGVYRMLNDKHWFSDVVAGAGIGILSTEAAYWLYPKINNILSGKIKFFNDDYAFLPKQNSRNRIAKISKTNIGKILVYKTVSRGMLRWSSYFFVDI
jgi:membrane-associated phospholipid phosphatase